MFMITPCKRPYSGYSVHFPNVPFPSSHNGEIWVVDHPSPKFINAGEIDPNEVQGFIGPFPSRLAAAMYIDANERD